MRTPQPLTIVGAAILGFYAGSLGVAVVLPWLILRDRDGRICGQPH